MAGVNKVILLGNLGKDPDIRTLESGTKLARVSLATNDYFKNKSGETIERTEWHNVVLWHQRAELAEKYLRKGSQLYVEGRLQTRQWEDKEGNKRYTTEIIADVINLVGGRPEAGDTTPSPPDSMGAPADSDMLPEEDDLPF
ncbi:MAG: single-stranded DNA-binding protein [Bacteroidales bacterium]|nr:single-stranded DNA-binding protein [Bacteroidales bacterium]